MYVQSRILKGEAAVGEDEVKTVTLERGRRGRVGEKWITGGREVKEQRGRGSG